MNKFTEFIIRRPVKIIVTTLIIMAILAIGITGITLKTGNDTLISDTTDTYKDNEAYQNEFGKDPIILLFEEDEQFSPSTLKLMNTLQSEIQGLEGVFSINSPVTVMNEIAKQMYAETNTGLSTMADSITTMGKQLASNDPSNLPDITALTNVMQDLINAQETLGQGLNGVFDAVGMMQLISNGLDTDLQELKLLVDADPLLVDEQALVNSLIIEATKINNNLATLSSKDSLKDVPVMTSQGLGNILATLQQLSTTLNQQFTSLQMLSGGLITIGENLSQLQKNFNTFYPGFPTSDETINMMTHENGVLRENFNGFIVSETQIRMVIVLDGTITDEQIDIISDTLFNRLEEEQIDSGVLISGKPILDRSIKSSMMESMKFMMISAIIVMILILVLFYNVRMRLLPMFMILIAVVVTIGIMGWLNMGLTMVSMAVFPILIGLGIDYFIQFQTRYEEERGKL